MATKYVFAPPPYVYHVNMFKNVIHAYLFNLLLENILYILQQSGASFKSPEVWRAKYKNRFPELFTRLSLYQQTMVKDLPLRLTSVALHQFLNPYKESLKQAHAMPW